MKTTDVQPIAKKIEAKNNTLPPKNVKQVPRFPGLINNNRDMIHMRLCLIAPISHLTGKTDKNLK